MTEKKPATRIVNRGRGHSYYLDDQKVPGVTTILSQGIPKPQFVESAVKDGANWMNDHWDEFQTMTPSQRFEAVRAARWNKLRAAGERGREVHELVHRYVIGEKVTPPEDLAGHFEAGCKFVDEWQVEEIAVEVAVFHRPDEEAGRPLPYGGRFDLIARLCDGNTWMLDYKTTISGVWPETALQLAAYRYADFYVLEDQVDEDGVAIEHPMPAIDRTGVVWLSADGSYELTPVEGDHKALEVFTVAQQVAAFAQSERDEWIGSPLRPPARSEEAAA